MKCAQSQVCISIPQQPKLMSTLAEWVELAKRSPCNGNANRYTTHEELESPDANAPYSPGRVVHYGKYTLVSRAVRERLAAKLGLVLVILTSLLKQHESYFGTDLVILNRGQTTRMTPELASIF
ncbi:hypothetical protein AVEN_264282-1 [Araneus ventricosus]|uniref:Uncharacterized protein n=1 Tax=Araneus ventricosus TaxID=182803 RepID=A0A4Y2T7C3_ARAVE|nr:hypothetical protein AVEN_152705-1 [Araneus ventricosus]GBN96528.1 hypothetical protein AVEN_264282-1 [Araneus ventricosus]